MKRMSTSFMPRPADIAARTSATIRSLTDDQLAAVMTSSQRQGKRALPDCWATVKTAAPELASTLDDLHAREIAEDLPRFEALASQHEKQLNRAVKGRDGQLTALSVLAAFVVGIATAILGLTGVISAPFLIAGATVSVGLLAWAYIKGRRLARESGNWLFANPEAAAAIVWDAGIDAAAATALRSRAGTSGLTSDVLASLSAVWTDAGLDTALLAPPEKPAPAPAKNPFLLMDAHEVYAGRVVETAGGEMFRFTCKCGQGWDSPADAEDGELVGPAAHIKDIMDESATIAQNILDRADKLEYPLTDELRGLLEQLAQTDAPAI
jgi:hypothetical protein